jgi:hypothetical protein
MFCASTRLSILNLTTIKNDGENYAKEINSYLNNPFLWGGFSKCPVRQLLAKSKG